MGTQRVKNVVYCAESVINLADMKENNAYDALLVPKGASIIQLLVEVQNTSGSGSVDVKLKEQDVAFLENVSLDSTSKDSAFINSSVHTISQMVDILSVELKSGAFTSGTARVKIVYFMPSQILVEF